MKFRPSSKTKKIIELLTQAGAADCLFVGGCVRDCFLGGKVEDYDIEVYGLDYDAIAAALQESFRVDLVGRSFGVIKVGKNIDVSIPRRESKWGEGHTGFKVETDSTLTPEEAFGRRDFTVNAIGMRLDGTLVDPYNGRQDIEKKILRATTDAFCEDPLRVLRGMQFISRFGFTTDSKTLQLCRKVLPEFETLSAERVWGEWVKWAVKGKYPSKGIRFLEAAGWIIKFSEINALRGCPQNPQWHPEGDVFVHTLQVCNEAGKLADEMELDANDRTVLMFAALGHDFGKPTTTFCNEQGQWRSPNHAAVGSEFVKEFLTRMKPPNRIVEQVVPLVKEHGGVYRKEATEKAVRRLSVWLQPAGIRLWAALCRADGRGNDNVDDREEKILQWEELAVELGCVNEPPKPILQGRDLLPLGLKPGIELGKILHTVYELQLDGVITDLNGAVEWVRKNYAAKITETAEKTDKTK